MRIFKNGERWMFDAAAEFYGWMTWQEVWRAHCRSLVDYFPGSLPARARVLDLGIGPGVSGISILDRLPEAEVVGVDYSPRMLAVARGFLERTGARVELVEADAAALPFPDASFDVVVGHSFLYLVPDQAGVMREAARVLRPGGGCVFLEPHEGGSHRAWMGLAGPKRFKLSMALWRLVSGRIRRFEARELRGLLERELAEVRVEETLGGLGLVGVGRRRGE